MCPTRAIKLRRVRTNNTVTETMAARTYSNFQERVVQAAEAVLKRQGLLITADALPKAEDVCAADAPERAAARAQAVVERQEEDREFVDAPAIRILACL